MASAKPKGGLTAWFGKGSKGDWVDIGAPKKNGKYQPCGRKSANKSKRAYPKCVPRSKANQMTESQRISAVRRKRAAGNPGGKPTNVKTITAKKGGFIATGCGQVMNNRRKTTKIY
mgnify:CR=1 FL=1|tara:strand:- start:156 stop:503 length:348 start_codon:yes stop_codon:yes gene_type:complete